jgi:protein-disulfide isomerase
VTTHSKSRRLPVRAVLAALALGAAGLFAFTPGQQPAAAQALPAASTVTVSSEGDITLGSPAARVVLTEYGAPTCPICKAWHDQVYMSIKRDFIATGRIRFAFRELPSHNPPVDAAIFGLARCVDKSQYFNLLDEAFARQAAIETASRSANGPVAALIDLGGRFGLSSERAQACWNDTALRERLAAVRAMGERQNVEGTPTLFINGQPVPQGAYGPRELAAALEAAIQAAR